MYIRRREVTDNSSEANVTLSVRMLVALWMLGFIFDHSTSCGATSAYFRVIVELCVTWTRHIYLLVDVKMTGAIAVPGTRMICHLAVFI